jgi:hypothetical protein
LAPSLLINPSFLLQAWRRIDTEPRNYIVFACECMLGAVAAHHILSLFIAGKATGRRIETETRNYDLVCV